MPLLDLHPPTEADLDELLRFELDNRAYFESLINARPADYYSAEGVARAIAAAEREAAEDKAYQFLIRDEGRVLVGRINLVQVRRTHFHCAHVGYRVAQAQVGRGIASAALALVIERARGLGLIRLEAQARPENIGSCTVLRRNGFSEFGRATRSMELHGQWFDVLHFERRLTR